MTQKIGNWSPRELEILREMHATSTNQAVAKRLRRSEQAVKRMAHRLGLTKSAAHVAAVRKAMVEAHHERLEERRIYTLPPLGPGYGPRTLHKCGV